MFTPCCRSYLGYLSRIASWKSATPSGEVEIRRTGENRIWHRDCASWSLSRRNLGATGIFPMGGIQRVYIYVECPSSSCKARLSQAQERPLTPVSYTHLT